MRIIAFSGKKQSGKTTAANDLGLRMNGCPRIDFADCLKELVFSYFAAPTEAYKDTAYETFTSEESKTRIHPCGKTYREILQTVGTDMFRGLWPDIWIENYKFRLSLEEDYDTIITSDVRFPNEVKCIQSLGGHVIRLLRNPHNDQHESETAIDYMETPVNKRDVDMLYEDGHEYYSTTFDYILDNRKMTIPEQSEAIWKLVQEKELI